MNSVFDVFLVQSHENQKFRKGVGGQRELARGDPSYPYQRFRPLFCALFFYDTLRRRGTQFWGSILPCLGPCFSPTPSRQPLKKSPNNPGLVNQVPATPQGHLHWARPIDGWALLTFPGPSISGLSRECSGFSCFSALSRVNNRQKPNG